jgi:DNA-binding GntR family transcriptional regulator
MAGQFAHRTVAASAADAIRRKVFDGQLKDGEPLRQDLLAAEFGISRTTVREALVQIEAEGLAKIEPHKGAVMADASIANIEETFELREHAEIMEHCRQGRFAEVESTLARHIQAANDALIGLVAQPATLAPTGADPV